MSQNKGLPYVYITKALDGVKSMFQDDIGLPKAEFLSKYTERYGEVSLRFMKDILYCIVKRRKICIVCLLSVK